MKILCVCQKGNMRSVALAWLLKTKYKQDALAAGVKTASPDTQKMLYEWADIVVLTSNKYLQNIPQEYQSKLKVWHVGTDVWFKGYDDSLISKFQQFIDNEYPNNTLSDRQPP